MSHSIATPRAIRRLRQGKGVNFKRARPDREALIQPDQLARAAAPMPVGDANDEPLAILRGLEGGQLQTPGASSPSSESTGGRVPGWLCMVTATGGRFTSRARLTILALRQSPT